MMGAAVNASTMGMAIASLGVAYFSQQIDRRLGILIALMVLAIPTALLASAPNLAVFTVLRIAQGLCMASAFTLTLAYLGEHTSPADTASAFAAYITGNVASNLIGRLISAAVADHLGLATNFYFFALLNLAGALLVYFTIHKAPVMQSVGSSVASHFAAWAMHLRNPQLRASFGIAFCILFAFIGTFTYVNFVLVRPPFGVGMMTLGFVYFVFLPSIVTTPLAGRAVAVLGTRPTMWASLALAGIAVPLLLTADLAGRADRHGADGRRHVLRAGDRDRLRRPRGDLGPRLGQRHLSRLLFLRRPRRQRRARPGVRPSRLARHRRRHRAVADRRGDPCFQDDDRCALDCHFLDWPFTRPRYVSALSRRKSAYAITASTRDRTAWQHRKIQSPERHTLWADTPATFQNIVKIRNRPQRLLRLDFRDFDVSGPVLDFLFDQRLCFSTTCRPWLGPVLGERSLRLGSLPKF